MIIKLHEPYKKGKAGDVIEVSRVVALQLIAEGKATLHPDQTRLDYTPKTKEPEKEPQRIEVNNYYLPPEYYQDEGQGIEERPSFFQRLKNKIWPTL